MEISVVLHEKEHDMTITQAFALEPAFKKMFAPIDVCDDAIIRYINGSSVSEAEAKVAFKQRENVAKEIAEGLTKSIMEIMSKKDTINGYPIEK